MGGVGAVAGERRVIRVAMVHGPGAPEQDGVSDYTQNLLTVLADVAVEAVGVPVTCGGGRPLRNVAEATRRIRAVRPDLVHVQFAPSAYGFLPLPGLLPVLLPRALPVVTTVHEYGWWAVPARVPAPVWRFLEGLGAWDRETWRLVPVSRTVVVTNPSHADLVRRRWGTCPVEIPLAPNVERDGAVRDARQVVRRRLGIGPDSSSWSSSGSCTR